MKTPFLITVFLISMSVSFSQEIPQEQVPSVVINNFKEAFPKASDLEWEKYQDVYKVEFEIGFFSDHEAQFDASGKLLHHIEDISKGDLPKAVTNAIKAQFKDYRIDDVDKVTVDNTVTYKIELEKRQEEKTVTFTQDGTLIKK